MNLKDRILRWGSVMFWMGLIFYLSSQPKLPEIPGLSDLDYGDKILHAATYAVLALLLWRAIDPIPVTFLRLGGAIFLTVLYGLSDELHQMRVPGRCFDLLDLAADAFGAVFAAVILCKWIGGDQFGTRTARLRSERQAKDQSRRHSEGRSH